MVCKLLFLILLLLHFVHSLFDFLVITSISLCLSISALNIFPSPFLMNYVAVVLVLQLKNLILFFLFLLFLFNGVLLIIGIVLFDFINFCTLKVYQSSSFVLLHLASKVFAERASNFVLVIIYRIASFERRNDVGFSAWLLIFFLTLQSSTFLQHHKIRVFLDRQNLFYFFNVKIIIRRRLATSVSARLVPIREDLGRLTKHC